MRKVSPLLMKGPLVLQTQAGEKTKTRRIINPQSFSKLGVGFTPNARWRCPYGQPGDLLYVRETWAMCSRATDIAKIYYKASERKSHTEFHELIPVEKCGKIQPSWPKWKPAIHMPRAFSRLTLELTGVRIERVQDITPEDAADEGLEYFKTGDQYEGDLEYHYKDYLCKGITADNDGETVHYNNTFDCPVKSFRSLWDSINAKRGYGWDANPWVWVLEYTAHQVNVDEFIKRTDAKDINRVMDELKKEIEK